MTRICVSVFACLLATSLAWAQQPTPATPSAPAAPPTPTPTPVTPKPATAAAPTTPPKLPADLQKPRSQMQAEFAVAAGDTVLFAYQAKELTKRTTKILENQAVWLKEHIDLPISLEAYCDDDLPPEQTRLLCQNRGNAVKAELVRLGIAADRFKITSFLEAPAKKGGGATASGRKDEDKNRRNNRRVMTRIDG